MNAGQLMTALSIFPADTEILVARDEEGNGFNKLYSVQRDFIEKNADKHGSVDSVIHPDDLPDYDPEDIEPRIVIWP